MPLRIFNYPILCTAIGTAFSVSVSYAVTRLVLGEAGTPLPQIALYLVIGLPGVLTPITTCPLFFFLRLQRRMRLEVERLGLTDVLTELPNRRAFFDFATPFLTERTAADAPLTAMMIDVDHFKAINDTYGHDVGDMVLKRVAGVIRDEVAAAGAADWSVARLGGEEFAVIVDRLVPTAVGRLADRICGQVHRWVGAGANQEPVTVSVGVAFRAPGMSIDKLLKAADDAVYAAKRAGRDRWAFAGEGTAEARRRPSLKSLPIPANDRIAAI